MTRDEVLEIYNRELEKAKSAKDNKGGTNADPANVAYNAARTEIHAALQASDPPPGPHDDDEGDPELHHMRQKKHGKDLWKQADALVHGAGLTMKGAN